MGWAWGPQLLPGEGPSWPGAGGPSTERHSKEGAVGRVGNVIKQSQRVLIKSVPSRGTASKGLGEERGTDNRLGPSTRLAWGLARDQPRLSPGAYNSCLSRGRLAFSRVPWWPQGLG